MGLVVVPLEGEPLVRAHPAGGGCPLYQHVFPLIYNTGKVLLLCSEIRWKSVCGGVPRTRRLKGGGEEGYNPG